MKHGDGVKDIAFTVENCRAIYQVHSLDSAEIFGRYLEFNPSISSCVESFRTRS